tara:strand:+ start:10543 stop:11271 length:729 start_codon:yes stop_codon:yes gene_type:complete
MKIPYSDGSLNENKGCEKAPNQVAKLIDEVWSNENHKNVEFEIGENIDFKNNLKKADIYLGGDHSITYWTFKEFVKEQKNPGIIIFDAHPDLFNEFKEPTHGDWLYFLIEEKLIKPENIIIIGLRNSHVKEIGYALKNKIKLYPMNKIFNNIENVCDTIMELAMGFDSVYLSLDIDVLDPAFAPGTDYLEPGGLSSRELIYFIKRLKMLKKLKKVDLVEINPDKDINDMTSKLGAKIIKELY